MAMLDHTLCTEMARLVELLTTSGSRRLDEKEAKKLKKICKQSEGYVKHCFHLLMTKLEKGHAEIRLSAFQIVDQLFRRSHCFRELMLADFQMFLELTTEIDPEQPLPPPRAVAKDLKTDTLQAVHDWHTEFGKAYKKLALGYQFLQSCKKINFANIQAQNEAERRRAEARQEKQDREKQQQLSKAVGEMTDLTEEIGNVLAQAENCLILLSFNTDTFTFEDFDVPSATAPVDDVDDDDTKSEQSSCDDTGKTKDQEHGGGCSRLHDGNGCEGSSLERSSHDNTGKTKDQDHGGGFSRSRSHGGNGAEGSGSGSSCKVNTVLSSATNGQEEQQNASVKKDSCDKTRKVSEPEPHQSNAKDKTHSQRHTSSRSSSGSTKSRSKTSSTHSRKEQGKESSKGKKEETGKSAASSDHKSTRTNKHKDESHKRTHQSSRSHADGSSSGSRTKMPSTEMSRDDGEEPRAKKMHCKQEKDTSAVAASVDSDIKLAGSNPTDKAVCDKTDASLSAHVSSCESTKHQAHKRKHSKSSYNHCSGDLHSSSESLSKRGSSKTLTAASSQSEEEKLRMQKDSCDKTEKRVSGTNLKSPRTTPKDKAHSQGRSRPKSSGDGSSSSASSSKDGRKTSTPTSKPDDGPEVKKDSSQTSSHLESLGKTSKDRARSQSQSSSRSKSNSGSSSEGRSRGSSSGSKRQDDEERVVKKMDGKDEMHCNTQSASEAPSKSWDNTDTGSSSKSPGKNLKDKAEGGQHSRSRSCNGSESGKFSPCSSAKYRSNSVDKTRTSDLSAANAIRSPGDTDGPQEHNLTTGSEEHRRASTSSRASRTRSTSCDKEVASDVDPLEEADDDEDNFNEDEEDERLRQHGRSSQAYSLDIEVASSQITIQETVDNRDLLVALKESAQLIRKKFLPSVQKWLKAFGKCGAGQAEVKQALDIREKLQQAAEKISLLKIMWRAKVNTTSDLKEEVEEEEEDFEEVPEKEGYEADVPEHLREESPQQRTREQSKASSISQLQQQQQQQQPWKKKQEMLHEEDPASWQSTFKKMASDLALGQSVSSKDDTNEAQSNPQEGSSSGAVSQPTRPQEQELIGSVPQIPYGTDLYHWGEKAETPMLVRYESDHRFWVSRGDEAQVDRQALASMQSRVINFVGEFQPVKWACRAPLPSSRLCPRRDRFKCPFHGKIIARDEAGQPVREEDLLATAAATEEKEKSKKDNKGEDWEDEELQRDIEAATGKTLTRKGKGKGKGKGKAKGQKKPESNLTDIKKVNNTSRNRLEKRVLSSKALARVASAMDSLDYKRFKDRFGNNFNYAM